MGKIPGLVKSSKSPRVLSTSPEMSVIDTNNKIYRISSMSKGISNHPYFSDPLVVPRVKQYLEENRSNLFVNLDDIVEVLQKKYREYGRKKRSAFKSVVKKALEVVIHSYGIAERSPSYDVSEDSDDDDDDDDDIDVDVEDENDMMDESSNNVNNHLVSMYMQNQKQGSGPGQELINISSDEDTNNDSVNHKPPSSKTGLVTITRTPKIENTLSSKSALFKSGTDNESTNPLKRKALSLNTPNKRRRTVPVTIPAITFKDIGGCEKVIKEVSQLLLHIRHPEVYKTLGVSAPRGFLLHGPPGSGKTLLAHAIAGELGVSLVKVAGPEMVGSQSGESEERIRDLFDQALALAPSVLFIDEVDAITPHRETAQREMERRIVAQLLSSLDELGNQENGEQVLVIGATNRPDALDPALRRAGRFDKEVCLGIPDSSAREGILKTLCKELKLAVDVSLDTVALMSPGFVGADLKALVTEAAMAAVNRLFSEIKASSSEEQEIKDCSSKAVPTIKVEESKESKPEVSTDDVTLVSTTEENIEIEVIEDEVKVEVNVDTSDEVVEVSGSPRTFSLLKEPPLTPLQLANLFITMKDFQIALKSVQPSAKREGFATVPDVTWDDIGSLQDIRQELQMAIMAPVRYPKQFEALGLNKPTGVLLCGPPGCGKTLLAKAVANEAGINFISVKGPELLNMYVGESERAVRQCFQRARNSQPCVIFFDELDALCPKRSNLNETGASRVVNQLLTEMDGVEGRTGVFLMAATNRPDIVDPAVMRPGRLDKVLYVGLPAQSDRVDILRALTKNGTKPVLSQDVKLEDIANDSHCEGYTGADLAALIREAGVQALKEFMADPDKSLMVAARHFTSAFEKIRPSVSSKDQLRYEQLRVQYAAVPSTK